MEGLLASNSIKRLLIIIMISENCRPISTSLTVLVATGSLCLSLDGLAQASKANPAPASGHTERTWHDGTRSQSVWMSHSGLAIFRQEFEFAAASAEDLKQRDEEVAVGVLGNARVIESTLGMAYFEIAAQDSGEAVVAFAQQLNQRADVHYSSPIFRASPGTDGSRMLVSGELVVGFDEVPSLDLLNDLSDRFGILSKGRFEASPRSYLFDVRGADLDPIDLSNLIRGEATVHHAYPNWYREISFGQEFPETGTNEDIPSAEQDNGVAGPSSALPSVPVEGEPNEAIAQAPSAPPVAVIVGGGVEVSGSGESAGASGASHQPLPSGQVVAETGASIPKVTGEGTGFAGPREIESEVFQFQRISNRTPINLGGEHRILPGMERIESIPTKDGSGQANNRQRFQLRGRSPVRQGDISRPATGANHVSGAGKGGLRSKVLSERLKVQRLYRRGNQKSGPSLILSPKDSNKVK